MSVSVIWALAMVVGEYVADVISENCTKIKDIVICDITIIFMIFFAEAFVDGVLFNNPEWVEFIIISLPPFMASLMVSSYNNIRKYRK